MKRMRRWLLSLCAGLVIAAFAAAGAAFWAYRNYTAPGPLEQEITLMLERGEGMREITEKLAEKNIIRHPLVMQIGAVWEGRAHQFKAGEYGFKPGISAREIATMMAEGRVLIHKVTAPEGRSVREILAILAQEEALTGEVAGDVAEGSLMPETYYFTRGDTRQSIIGRMQESMRKTVQELWEKRKENLPVATPEQAVVLASIVEKETGVPEERPRVAAVFTNRLRQGMKLQSDPTVAYGLERQYGQPLKRPLYTPDLRNPTPYNTYVIDGLPPTPITNPGRAALAAAMNPPESNELYFVATGTGGHRFAATLEEHNANVQAYRAVQAGQNSEH